MAGQKILLWGGKTKARIAESMLEENGHKVSYIFDQYLDRPDFETNAAFGNTSSALMMFLQDATHFLVCIGGEHGFARVSISNVLEHKFGLKALGLTSEAAYIDKTSTCGKGLQIMPGAVIHKFSTVGDYSLVNTNATVDHDCVIGDGVHIMGGASIAGCVSIGDYATVGTNATVLPRIVIGKGAFIGAGAVVTKDVPDNHIAVGVPARLKGERKPIVDLTMLNACMGNLSELSPESK